MPRNEHFPPRNNRNRSKSIFSENKILFQTLAIHCNVRVPVSYRWEQWRFDVGYQFWKISPPPSLSPSVLLLLLIFKALLILAGTTFPARITRAPKAAIYLQYIYEKRLCRALFLCKSKELKLREFRRLLRECDKKKTLQLVLKNCENHYPTERMKALIHFYIELNIFLNIHFVELPFLKSVYIPCSPNHPGILITLMPSMFIE